MNIMSNIARAWVLLILFGGVSLAAGDYPGNIIDRLSLRAVRTLDIAEVTYFATTGGNNNYGSLSALGEAHLIDAALATGNKYGHIIVVSVTAGTPTSPPNFAVTATPRVYIKTGRWSFFIDARGEIHGADKGGQPATETDPIIDECTQGSIIENERCIIESVRTVHSAEVTYFSTSGNNANYTGLAGLARARLINGSLASGQLRGYSISVIAFPQTPTESARYRATAVPQIYGITGLRSFFINETGVIHGADHQGGPANENDPPIGDFCGGSIVENEQCTIQSMRTVHSAEVTWFSIFGNNTNYTGLVGLARAGLISPSLASGRLYGYSISVIAFPQTPTGYRANAVPQIYGTTGIRSFFVDENGVIHGADHQGGPANENDPPV